MTEYIKREDVHLALDSHYFTGELSLKETIDSIPSADVRPVVRGYWKSVPHKRARVCSRCEADEPYKFADVDANVYDFCPHCGAQMEEHNAKIY